MSDDSARGAAPRTSAANSTIDLRATASANPVEIISVAGEIDVATAPRLHERLTSAFDHDPSELIVDLSDVSFIDSTGLGVLVNARQRARSIGAVLKVKLPDGQARFAFEVTGLVSVFETLPQSS